MRGDVYHLPSLRRARTCGDAVDFCPKLEGVLIALVLRCSRVKAMRTTQKQTPAKHEAHRGDEQS